ncbi:MAG: hypothetical protein GY806_13870 [Gammaproteobacteria bacterium]|nr:hypothetical protein [Gammaproteobacteria bacterium]
MKKIFYILLVSVSLNTGASEGEENANISTSALSLDNEPYSSPKTSSPSKRGHLEETKIAIGTILKSHHFDKYDYHDYNESHNGIYININKWSTGMYTNSADEQSVFITYNPNLYTKKSFKVNLVAGITNGYDGWENAQGDYLLTLGVSAQWMYLKTMLSYDAVAFGIELPLN